MVDFSAQPLDPLCLPLSGERLIEASAGTGKTFTIAALYLRLLLGLGGDSACPRQPDVKELLVVTFTEAATEELRGRIRARIHELRVACIRGRSSDALLSRLLDDIPDRRQAARALLLAERQMDEAAIFTIHGFCQRMLSLNAFESGMLFEQRLLEDESLLRQQACADFWRRHCYPLARPVAQAVSELWSGPDALLQDVNAWLQGEAPLLRQPPAQDETLEQRHAAIVARIDSLKAQWRAAACELEALIAASGVDKRSFSSKYLPAWLEKVGVWAQQETVSYQLPEALAKFSQSFLIEKTKKGEAPRHPLFEAIDALLAGPLTLRDWVIARAMVEIRESVAKEKQRRGELGFDDMLSRLDAALRQPGGEQLAAAIRRRFPVAMIDEFQDTDPQQYRIFHRIWIRQPDSALLLIGDPKQAIYAFRGADIFTYMRARSEVSAHYTLDTNWRSSPGVVAGVNALFSHQQNPFLFRQIPFLPVNPAAHNAQMRFTVNGVAQHAMRFWLLAGEGVSVSDYQQAMAQRCAAQIRDWLEGGQGETALLWRGETARPVRASDITVLVRSRSEAAVVREALAALNIPSVYLSNRDSVFATQEAREILWLLQAVLAPGQESALRCAMATSILGLDARTLDTLSQNEDAWDALVEEFDGYRQRWRQRGVMPMIRELMARRGVAENLLASPGGERRLTDVLHISELLQAAAAGLDSEHALVRWLAQNIAEPDSNAAVQQLRLESDRHLVQVVTIHKSKGLEYSLVCLPFIASFRPQKQALYHDRRTFDALLDLSNDAESLALAEEERLAEDLRLLYVALTRAVWHVSVGVAPLFRGSRTKKGASDLHHSAIGWLLQRGEAMNAAQLYDALAQFCRDDISLEVVEPGATDCRMWQPSRSDSPSPVARKLRRPLQNDWRVTSYTGLQRYASGSVAQALLPRLDIDAAGAAQTSCTPLLTPHTFPRGASPGTFLHGLFEQLDFTRPIDAGWLGEQLRLGGFDEAWQPVLCAWLSQVLAAPLNAHGVSLNQLSVKERLVELAFYLPIDAALSPQAIDALTHLYDPLSAQCPPLDFQRLRGMLKGFIDLVFCWQGRYYLLDYKSNWLGENGEAYTPQAMAKAMCEHRYDLQYQLYTLALHRYLRHRIPDYDYERHFGGVIYLFLRGIDEAAPAQGIFTTRPAPELVAGFDALFAGVTEDIT
ncbi:MULTISPECIES: exodeoxyribonuclease V subunit beta [Tenebrionibacter/Tenebrionicola group]|jgi:exodeoxyribonuclease V beta subunit|uniref:RecBCD enzyme subunit RecB n=2 Tax=Tenebrionibacter/Tenebrionicola group TaxID=2969848 RepID=A0A8K0V4C3_9ENTR|nr:MULTISPECIES: exodeoxyribonuclease V subunit beta [Tenebrionibacter/Tenebrionicola group]MBK4714920.1 exodeoxyribonuclease V subunit beta [Tenebrionibacter intestinalis]MBV5095746.1 exodeoxyribonuclease V subunit beta [Tenebrionicola larvae]